MGNQGVILPKNIDISLFHSVQTGCEVQVASLNWGLLPQGQNNQVMKLSTNFQYLLSHVFIVSCLMKENTLSSDY